MQTALISFFGAIGIILVIAALLKFVEWLTKPKQEDVVPQRRRKHKHSIFM